MKPDIKVSYWKVLEILTGYPLYVPDIIAERELAKALSDRQKKKLNG